MKQTPSGAKYVDPLRASADDVAMALEQMHHEQGKDDARRDHQRHQFKARVDVELDLHQPGGSMSQLLVRAQDMSNQGLGFLSGGFVYPGSTCRMWMTTLYGEKLQVNGVVRHCRCVRGKVHYVGVQFESAIDTSLFIKEAVPAKPQVIEETTDPDAVAKLSQKLRKMALLNSPIDEQRDLYRELGAALGLPVSR